MSSLFPLGKIGQRMCLVSIIFGMPHVLKLSSIQWAWLSILNLIFLLNLHGTFINSIVTAILSHRFQPLLFYSELWNGIPLRVASLLKFTIRHHFENLKSAYQLF